MNSQKTNPILEKIRPDIKSTFKLLEMDEKHTCHNPYWHIHPEYELTYISSGVGKRQVGTHISFFTEGELIFLGPYVPHFRFSMGEPQVYKEVTLQIPAEFLEKDLFTLPEFPFMNRLKSLSLHGISYGDKIRKEVGEKMHLMCRHEGYQRLELVLMLLELLELVLSILLHQGIRPM